VRQEYLNLAHLDPERFLVVDATLDIEQIHQIIIERVGAIKLLKRNTKQ
jgi:dTMP kinase